MNQPVPGVEHEESGQAGAPWFIRRLWVAIIMVYCGSMNAYIVFKGIETKPAETFVSMSMLLMGTTIGTYLFGAVWNNLGSMQVRRQHWRDQRYAPAMPLPPA